MLLYQVKEVFRNGTFIQLFKTFYILQGYIGDRIGYRVVIIINLIIVTLSATSFDWTPRFIEYYRTPTVTFNATSDVAEVLQFQWPIQDCSIENITINNCKSDFILSEQDFWLNLDIFSTCSPDNISLILNEVPEFMCKIKYLNKVYIFKIPLCQLFFRF